MFAYKNKIQFAQFLMGKKPEGHNFLFDVLLKEQNTNFNTGHMAAPDKKCALRVHALR